MSQSIAGARAASSAFFCPAIPISEDRPAPWRFAPLGAPASALQGERRLAVGGSPGGGEGAAVSGEGDPPGEGGGEVGEGGGGGEAPGGGPASPSALLWHIFGEVGTGEGSAALVTADDLAALDARTLYYAAVGTTSTPSRRYALGSVSMDEVSQSSAEMRGENRIEYGRAGIGRSADGTVYAATLNFVLQRTGANSWKSISNWGLRSAHDTPGLGETRTRRWSGAGGAAYSLRRQEPGGVRWAVVATDHTGAEDDLDVRPPTNGMADWLATGNLSLDAHERGPERIPVRRPRQRPGSLRCGALATAVRRRRGDL